MQRVLYLLQAHNYWLTRITSIYPLYFQAHHVSNLPSSEQGLPLLLIQCSQYTYLLHGAESFLRS